MARKKGKTLKIFTGWSLAFILFVSVFATFAFASPNEDFQLFELRVVGDDFKNTSTDSSSTTTTTSTVTSPYNCDEVQQTQDGKNFCGNVKSRSVLSVFRRAESAGPIAGTHLVMTAASNPKGV